MTIPELNREKRYTGKIIHLNKRGFGFIVSKDIEFTRIYFHWSGLNPSAPHFTELQKGDEVEFNAIEYVDRKTNEDKGVRAIKIDVLEPESNNGDKK